MIRSPQSSEIPAATFAETPITEYGSTYVLTKVLDTTPYPPPRDADGSFQTET